MRKFIISAIVAAVATVSFAAPSLAGGCNDDYGYSKSYGHKNYGYKKTYGHKQYGYKNQSYKTYGYKKHYNEQVVVDYDY